MKRRARSTGLFSQIWDSKQIDFWAVSAEDLYYEALTDNVFKASLTTFPQKIIIITQETSNLTKLHLEKLHLLSNAMEVAMKIGRCWEK